MEHQFNYMEHQFNVQLAKEYGIEEAILIHNMFFWINKNAVNNKHLYDGHYWTYNTQKALSDLFPYIHETKIQRSLKFLCECDFIIKGNFNKNKLDRTCWYAFSDKAISILQNEGYDISKMKNANYQNEATIPYSKHTDSNTYKKEDTNVSKKEDKKKLTFSEDVEYLYSLYPSKCPKRNMSTGKSSNDKEKIKRLLTTMPKEELEFTIKSYVEECVRNDVFLKNFSTLLNNLPDMGYSKEQPIIKAQTGKYR